MRCCIKARRRNNAQVCAVVPQWIGEVSTQSIDKDFVLVELEDDVWKPPEAFALLPLDAVAITRRPARRRCGLQGPLDDLGYLHTRCKRESTTCGGLRCTHLEYRVVEVPYQRISGS